MAPQVFNVWGLWRTFKNQTTCWAWRHMAEFETCLGYSKTASKRKKTHKLEHSWVTVENRLTPDYINHGWWMRRYEGCMFLLGPGTSLKCQPMLRCSKGSSETPIQTLPQICVSPCRFHEGGLSLLILEPASQASQSASWQKSLSSRRKICFLSSVTWQRQLIEIQ